MKRISTKRKWWVTAALVAALATGAVAQDPVPPVLPGQPNQPGEAVNADAEAQAQRYVAHKAVVEATAAMVRNRQAHELAQRHGLNVLNVTWEDTGRFKNSAVGPNISDMTIQMQLMDPRTEKFDLVCMPVIRFPNFADKSADLPIDKFHLLVGNEKGAEQLEVVTLKHFLENIRHYLSKGDSWAGDRQSLLADRDAHVLVSAQACFLPVPQQGIAEFNPVLFNYQSVEGDPAVVTILCTPQGTSVTIIDNKRDGFAAGRTWGQRLFFNKNGERAVLTGQRMSDFVAEQPVEAQPGQPAVQAAGQQGLNMVLLIQVPLLQKNPMRSTDMADAWGDSGALQETMRRSGGGGSDVEEAVIGHGRVEGPYTEIDGIDIQRDARFPIRVTVQFYKATSNGIVNEADLAAIAAQISKVYEQADYVGSLAVDGHTTRPTEHDGPKVEPPGWWAEFWNRHELNTGMTRADTMIMLQKLLGPNWQARNGEELAEAVQKMQAEREAEQQRQNR